MGDVELRVRGQRAKESPPAHARVRERGLVWLGGPQQSEHPRAAAEPSGSLSSCIQIGR